MPEKDFQIKFSARDDGTYGRVLKQTADGLRSLKGEAAGIASSITGGLIGGGLAAFFMTLVDKIQGSVREMRELKKAADELNITPQSARAFQNIELGLGAKGVFTGGIQAARKRRADALAGDPEAISDFNAIGLSLKQIKNLSPDTLFFRIAAAFEKFDENATDARSRFFAGSNILGGSGSAEALIPYFRGGIFNESRFFGESGGIFGAAVLEEGAAGRYKKDFEPLSSFGLDTQRRANKLGEDNRNRAIDLVRSQLPPEEQLNRLLAERVSLEREISAATSPLRREQLVSRLLDLDGNILGLDQQQRALGAKMLPTGAAYPRGLDELSRAGFFTGGSPRQLLDINRQQLRELQKSVDLLRGLPAGLGKEI